MYCIKEIILIWNIKNVEEFDIARLEESFTFRQPIFNLII